MYGPKKLGTATLSNNAESQAIAKIKFDGDEDVFDPEKLPDDEKPYAGVSGMFKADLKYNNSHDTDDDGNKVVKILEKTYRLQMPGDIITYTIEKTVEDGAIDIDNGTIEWTVTITATKDTKPATPIDLAGYVFEDDLGNVDEYFADSFLLSPGPVVPANLVTPGEGSHKLTYIFPEDSESPQEIKFKTEIPEDVMTAGGSITNSASLYLDDDEVGFDDFPVTISKPSATKSGITNDVSSGETYDPTNRTITWYIEVDNKGRTLNNLTITDALKGGLIFDSAQWQKRNAADTDWEDTAIGWATADKPIDNKYPVGDVDYIGRLKIVSKVPDSVDGSVIATTYYNQASLSWSGVGDTTGSAVTGNPDVGIGYDAISKNGTQSADDVDNHQITWTINTDMKGQSVTGFKIYDLFVHDGDTPDSAITGAADWPTDLGIVTRNDGQKFVKVVSKADDLAVTPTDLENESGEVIATLVEITNLNASASNEVVLKSQVLDPDIIAGNNAHQKVNNTASLYKNTAYRGQAGASVNYNNKVLAKEMLNRTEVGNDHTTGVGSINANNRTISVANGFHYDYKEVIFRLNINAAGLDFANVETNLADGFGDVTVTDLLPAGWEFSRFSGGEDYLIYSTTGVPVL